jgi:hypothetical protein
MPYEGDKDIGDKIFNFQDVAGFVKTTVKL